VSVILSVTLTKECKFLFYCRYTREAVVSVILSVTLTTQCKFLLYYRLH
jgi:hypothetical protein